MSCSCGCLSWARSSESRLPCFFLRLRGPCPFEAIRRRVSCAFDILHTERCIDYDTRGGNVQVGYSYKSTTNTFLQSTCRSGWEVRKSKKLLVLKLYAYHSSGATSEAMSSEKLYCFFVKRAVGLTVPNGAIMRREHIYRCSVTGHAGTRPGKNWIYRTIKGLEE